MKVLAVASVGGHWIQLLRLKPAFKDMDLVFASTRKNFGEMVPGHRYYYLPDSNRKEILSFFIGFYKMVKIFRKEKPHVVITTGSAPGLLGILVGKFYQVKTIWVDSMANVEELSLSGKIACKLSDRVYTQWPELATNKILYKGNTLL